MKSLWVFLAVIVSVVISGSLLARSDTDNRYPILQPKQQVVDQNNEPPVPEESGSNESSTGGVSGTSDSNGGLDGSGSGQPDNDSGTSPIPSPPPDPVTTPRIPRY